MAHPRSRGENVPPGPRRFWIEGSSPLTRGKPNALVPSEVAHGLIPAHAGKTSNSRRAQSKPSAHPRSRGENGLGLDRLCLALGSSPLTRGKHQSRRECRRRMGLIPAHAGKTHRRSAPNGIKSGSSPLTRGKHLTALLPDRRDRLIPAHAGKTGVRERDGHGGPAHPRSRGENEPISSIEVPAIGSSPLTRGKPRLKTSTRGQRRLIPAHAGKTTTDAERKYAARAHPRSRGENLTVGAHSWPPCGSSPLTRGKPSPCRRGGLRPRLIPAHAGKTPRGARCRLCARGSSPLTRGKRLKAKDVAGPGGLIPAHAGKTAGPSATSHPIPAHPRSRGENVNTITAARAIEGSSPLTRGKHRRRRQGRRDQRLIPAHAGKT